MSLLESQRRCMEIQKMVYETRQSGQEINAFFLEKENWEVTREDEVRVRKDVRYNSKYPNNFLDIWYSAVNPEERKPTIVDFHGGGFMFGDKGYGDPLAMNPEGSVHDDLLRNGYNLVSCNYALAPYYRFPVQIMQVNDALAFLLKHAEELGLDMSRTIISGSSAGADFTEIYGLVLSDPLYAEKLGIQPAITAENVKCLLINEAALIPESNHANDGMRVMFENWLGVDNIVDSPEGDLLRVAERIGDRYFPSYLIASNVDPFFNDDALAMHKKLESIGVPNDYIYYPQNVDILDHGFMGLYKTNPYAREAYNRYIAFLNQYSEK